MAEKNLQSFFEFDDLYNKDGYYVYIHPIKRKRKTKEMLYRMTPIKMENGKPARCKESISENLLDYKQLTNLIAQYEIGGYTPCVSMRLTEELLEEMLKAVKGSKKIVTEHNIRNNREKLYG